MTNVARKILIVDDDEDFLFQMKIQLESLGFSVISAYSEQQARDYLDTELPDLAILDLMMEHRDSGFVLSHHIKKLDSNIPVILVTAVTSETGLEFDAATEEERSWVKSDVVMAKPVRKDQLQREIHRLLGMNRHD